MPLSDDELDDLEYRANFDIFTYEGTEERDGHVRFAKAVRTLVAELRAARKVVEAARAFMDAGPSVAYYDARLGLPFGDGPEWEDDLKNALAEYDAASAEPQEQPA